MRSYEKSLCRSSSNLSLNFSLNEGFLESLEKYTVDVLGRYNPVKKEKRHVQNG